MLKLVKQTTELIQKPRENGENMTTSSQKERVIHDVLIRLKPPPADAEINFIGNKIKIVQRIRGEKLQISRSIIEIV